MTKTRSRLRPIRRLKLFAQSVLRQVTRRPPSTEEVTRANTRQAYEKLYSDPRLFEEYLASSRLLFFDEVASFCAHLRPARVIDLGCGTGHMLRALAKEWKSCQVDPLPALHGMDHAWSAIVRARAVVPDGNFNMGSIYRLSYPDASFDLIVSTETFEHLRDPNRALTEACRICRPGGYVLLTVPDGEVDDWEGHVNFWTMTTLRELLSRFVNVQAIRRGDEGRVLVATARKS